MTQWYYSDNERNRHGPLDGAEMIERHRRGELGPDTLVWREGLPQWQPWRELAAELIAEPGFAGAPDPAQLLSQRAEAQIGAAVAAAHERADSEADARAGRAGQADPDPAAGQPAATAQAGPESSDPGQAGAAHTGSSPAGANPASANQAGFDPAGFDQTRTSQSSSIQSSSIQSGPNQSGPAQSAGTSANLGDTHANSPTPSPNPGDSYLAANPQAEPDSPYAAPRAGVAEDNTVVLGHEVVYAGFWKRVAAYMIDSLLVTVVYYTINTVLALLGLFAFGAFSGDPSQWMSGGDRVFVIYTIVSYTLFGAISIAYYAGFESSAMQATLGKLAVGIKVVDDQGRRLSRGRAIGRWFSAMLSYLTLYVGYLMIAFTDRKRGLHDMVAKTQVVDRWAYTARPELQNRSLGTVALVVLILVGLVWALIVGALLVALGFAAFAS